MRNFVVEEARFDMCGENRMRKKICEGERLYIKSISIRIYECNFFLLDSATEAFEIYNFSLLEKEHETDKNLYIENP